VPQTQGSWYKKRLFQQIKSFAGILTLSQHDRRSRCNGSETNSGAKMITLWGRNNSTNVKKVRWVLEELDLP
jgi:glutathione S-transferase